MKFWKKYKSYSVRKQRILFLIFAYVLLSVAFMWMPISADQTGFPDLSQESVSNIVAWGASHPSVSFRDFALQADPDILQLHLIELQTALEETRFYRRTFPLNPLQWLSVTGSCLTIETDTGTYTIGHSDNRFFVEVNGCRRHYKSLDRWGGLRYEIRDLWMYVQDLEEAYYASTDVQ